MEKPIRLDLSLDFPTTRFSLEDSVEIIRQIQLQLEALEDYRLKLKWWMGCVLAHTDAPSGRRTKTVEEVARQLKERYGIRAGMSVLYQCLKLYTGLSGDFAYFVNWIADRKKKFGRPVYWYDVVNDLLGGKNNPAVIGREAADEADFRDAERGIEAIEKIMLRAAEGSEEAAGVVEGIRQSIVGLVLLAHSPATTNLPAKTPRSTDYLRFVASHGCLACGRDAEPHHAVGRRGTGVKPSDFGCVPLCRTHHRQLHQSGPRCFEEFHNVSMNEVALNLLHRFVTGRWLTITVGRTA